MPPPRRHRPVQSATRVRLPRTARPRTSPATEPAEAGLPAGDIEQPTELTDAGLPAAQAAVADQDTVAVPADEADEDELPNGGAGEGELPEDEADEDELPEDELPEDERPEDEAADEDLPDGESGGDADSKPAKDRGKAAAERAAAADRQSSLLLPACLGAVAVILGGLAIWFGFEASSVTSSVNTANIAMTDTAATRQVNEQIASAVNTVFSYNYADTARTSQAAANLLTGKAKGEYNTLFKLVQQDAPKEKLVLSTTVTNSGVEMLSGNNALLLIFADQRDTGGSANQTTDAGAMFAVNAVRQDGTWKISNINTFSAGG